MPNHGPITEPPTAITGTWSDLERQARYVYESVDHDTTDWELAEAVLVLLGMSDRQRDEIEQRAAENARLQDGVSGLISAIYAVYERAQAAARKPSPNV